MNLTINQHPQTNFKANIFKTEYLKSGFEAAARLAKEGKAEDSFAFYKAINNIKNNNNITYFQIANSKKPQISIGGYELEAKAYDKIASLENKTEGDYCLYSVINFAKRIMGMDLFNKDIPSGEEVISKLNELKKTIFAPQKPHMEETAQACLTKGNNPAFKNGEYVGEKTQTFIEKLCQEYEKDPTVNKYLAVSRLETHPSIIHIREEGERFDDFPLTSAAAAEYRMTSKIINAYRYEISEHLRNGMSIEEIAKLYNETPDWVKSVIVTKRS